MLEYMFTIPETEKDTEFIQLENDAFIIHKKIRSIRCNESNSLRCPC